MYDIFFISRSQDTSKWLELKQRFPYAKRALSISDAKKKSFTKMFWIVWDNISLLQSFDFSFVPDEWDRNYIHVFKNGDYYDGVVLIPKLASISSKEEEYRFFTNKKEIDIVASIPVQYEKYELSSYEEYLDVFEKSNTPMFYATFPDIEISKDFEFNFHVPQYERHLTFVFKNGNYYDGVCLFSTTNKVSKKEFDHRFFINKKEIDIVASIPKPFDIIFISYNETEADNNFNSLVQRFPRAKRVHGIKGIHNAHIAAAEMSSTEMFWVVDADAVIEPTFNFEFEQIPYYNRQARINLEQTVHVWRSRNPINDLEYGYGGVKLFPKTLTLAMDRNTPDMTTSISKNFKVMNEVSNITAFNTDPFSTWKSAFRECAKLAGNAIDRQNTEETILRLEKWCTVGIDRQYGDYAINGAIAGKKFAEDSSNDIKLINDFDWLYQQFEKSFLQ